MCKPASFIITKTDVLWSEKSDRHEDIIHENKLNDSTINPDFVRVEIVPENDDYRKPIEEWIYKKDHDFIPDWYSEKEAEIACRRELRKWAKSKIVENQTLEFENYNLTRIFINCKVKIKKVTGGSCGFYGSSQGTVSGQTGGDCRFCHSSKGTVSGQTGGYCWFYGSSQGTVSGQTGGYCRFYDSSKRIEKEEKE